jgi:hypothetical protein
MNPDNVEGLEIDLSVVYRTIQDFDIMPTITDRSSNIQDA